MNRQGCSILVVDDSATMRELLAGHLRRAGYQVTVVADGNAAIAALDAGAFDLVLLDVEMPEMNGLEVLTLIRERHSIAELPVIMVTGRDQSGDTIAALQMGANDYVTKPPNLPLVSARVQTHLAVKLAGQKAVQTASSASSTGSSPGTPTRATADTPKSGEVGPLCIGDYEVLTELGRGGMGAVFKARHRRMNRLVALKVIDREFLSNPDSVRRFYREVEAAAQLSHPNIVIAYDAGQCEDNHYLAMEYVDGVDLERLVGQAGPLRIGTACDYVRQAALGLQHAHERGLVHRDIKPSNLIVTSAKKADESAANPSPSADAVVKILDMGLALLGETKLQDSSLTKEGHIVGTADYMAPEHWQNAHTVDIRSDLYSLGCTFFFLLTGKVPYPAPEPMEKMLKHYLDPVPAVEEIRSEVPDKVAGVVRRLMAKRPEERYQTPAEVAELLRWYAQTYRDR
ncbi:hypothetical protein AYO40_01295 [Planctomycetaceae bacterium SCGC AG-212-D15]|nr:hypothetical protein AYO40_01295 [Planctomycetaceae bacterium SCGC AG-212-D15]